MKLRRFLLAGALAAGISAVCTATYAEDVAAYYEMNIQQDVGVPLSDGTELSANVFRPDAEGRFPVILTVGPYPKDYHFSEWSPEDYEELEQKGPNMHWETVDPDWWVPQGYVVIRVDQRGMGKSPGDVDLFSARETEDYRQVIEWAGTQLWSNGKVGLVGISYFAMSQWRVAATQPPHLAAIIPWEGASDLYRDAMRHGGILSNTFAKGWFGHRIKPFVHQENGKPTGTLSDLPALGAEHTMLDGYFEERIPDFSKIQVPLLSSANWGGLGLHLRGNVEGYYRAGSENKWLHFHTGSHIEAFYSLEGRALQKRFLDQWLKDIDTGMLREPRIKLAVRGSEDITYRYENEWPIARTEWTPYYLNAGDASLSPAKPADATEAAYEAGKEAETTSISFSTAPFETETEITGPVKLKLWVSADVSEADLFVALRNFDADGNEVTFYGANNPKAPVSVGWLRASHRALDPELSTEWRPFHAHTTEEPLTPGDIVPLEIEIWPTSMVYEKGHRLVVEVGSRDYPGVKPFFHTDPTDRSPAGTNIIHTGGDYDSHILLPVIPAR
ncbi:MAG: CocE/NonD family hydrolase [Rhizobiaceae bacterium]